MVLQSAGSVNSILPDVQFGSVSNIGSQLDWDVAGHNIQI